MYLPWKLYSFWLKVLAWLSLGAAIVLCLLTITETVAAALIYILYGAVAFVVWMAFAVCTSAAETYLRVGLDTNPEEDNSEVSEVSFEEE